MRARLLLLGAALFAYGASLASGFHFDDYAIFSQRFLQPGRAWMAAGVLARASFWLNDQLGRGTLLCHAFNLVLHLGAALLLYECLRRMANPRAAWLAAAIFAVHPLQAEAVNYVAARGFLLAAVLLLAALASWICQKRAWAIAFLAALLLANDQWSWHPGPGVHAAGFWLAQGVVAWRYLRLMVAPWAFTLDPDIQVPSLWVAGLAWGALLAVAAVLWRWRAKSPAAGWALAGLLAMIACAVFPRRDLAADYRMYVPMIGFTAAAGILLERVKPRAIATVLVVVLALLGAGRTWVWLSDLRLWREAERRAPELARPKLELAMDVRAGEALDLLGQAAAIEPHNPEIPAQTGKVLLDEQQYDAALKELSRALALDPRNPVTLNNQGVALAAVGQLAAARMDFETALAIDPDFAEARENLSRLPDR